MFNRIKVHLYDYYGIHQHSLYNLFVDEKIK